MDGHVQRTDKPGRIRALTLTCTLLTLPAFAQTELRLWNGNMPGKGAPEPEVLAQETEPSVTRITNVSEPTITFFPAGQKDIPNPAVLVCPGGGYRMLAFDKEGTEAAQWLNSIGVSAAVLKYRVPDNREGAQEDARQAMRMLREKHKAWNVDPNRIGTLGFSAGGHLAAVCSTTPERPAFTILIYPAYLAKAGSIEIVDEISINDKTPPAFVVQTQDDKNYYRSSLAYAAALDARGIPAELHLFAKGGHGYGLRPTRHPVSSWPQLCEAWMRSTGLLQDTQQTSSTP